MDEQSPRGLDGSQQYLLAAKLGIYHSKQTLVYLEFLLNAEAETANLRYVRK